MSLHRQGDRTKLHLQPGSELEYEQDGLIRGQIIYEGDRSKLSTAPAKWTKHPDEPLALCYHRRLTKLGLDRVRVTCSYIGLERDPSDFIVEMFGGLNREPIDTHKDFVSQIGGTKSAPLNLAKFDPDTGQFIGFPPNAPNQLGGVESYLLPTVSIRRTYWTYRQPDPRLMGHRTARPADIALPPGVFNMLWGPTTYRQVGRLYQVSEEQLGSGRRGWNDLIYPAG